MGKNGGYIAAPIYSVPGDVPPENIVALIDVCSMVRVEILANLLRLDLLHNYEN